MKLIELHILQSFPVSCLNRDDVGAPKTAVFGGCTRARISSQCLKRAIREMAQEREPALFSANRSRLIVEPLRDAMVAEGTQTEKALEAAKAVGDYLATFDAEKEKAGKLQVKTLMFLSPAEILAIAGTVAKALKRGDIVVFDASFIPGYTGQRFIKRVIGVPGDIVNVTNGKVSIIKYSRSKYDN